MTEMKNVDDINTIDTRVTEDADVIVVMQISQALEIRDWLDGTLDTSDPRTMPDSVRRMIASLAVVKDL